MSNEFSPDEIKPDNHVAKTYVWHKGKCFFVSTIERDSSADDGPRQFNETLVWEFDWATYTRLGIVWQGGCCRDYLGSHIEAVRMFYEHGKAVEVE